MTATHKLMHLTHPDAHVPRYEMPDTAAAPLSGRRLALGLAGALLLAVAAFVTEKAAHGVADPDVSLVWGTPFAFLLVALAVMPVVAPRWWQYHYAQVALSLAAVLAVAYCGFVAGGLGNVARAAADYLSFVFLLGSLYVVSGGILIRVRTRATPLANLTLLAVGVVLANVVGTTAASVLLIRPFLRLNGDTLRPYQVAFFIFTVANAGGGLTPVGPPLFLGFLQGVPFWWVLRHAWPVWLTANGLLLTLFVVIDLWACRRPPAPAHDEQEAGPAMSLYGAINLLFAGLIVAGILLQDPINAWSHRALGFDAPWRELIMAVAAFASLALTPARIHGENHFNYAPIEEVAVIFAGIFITMVPVLNYLGHHAQALPTTTPGGNFFGCGILSSVLDNAPTYLTFLKAAVTGQADGLAGLLTGPAGARRLTGISMGAVLFGGMTYIGNGPNFIVRSIVEHSGVPTPGFFAYILCYAVPILLPVLIVVWIFFLR